MSMTGIRTQLKRYMTDEAGASAIEYALIMGLMALAVIGGVTAMGTATNNKMTAVATEMDK